MNSVVSKPVLIGIDWGTSSFRAYLIGAQGRVLDRLESAEGIMKVPDQLFGEMCKRSLANWLAEGSLPIIASGMITSRNGWLETSYQPIPAGTDQLASALTPLHTKDGLHLHFMSGVSIESTGLTDVMRGEETQIIGAIETGISNATFVMPGTHSKWVTVNNDRIEQFATYMSGEVYEALCQHTILGTLMKTGSFCESRFREGVSKGLSTGSNLLHNLFQVRTLPLLGKMDETEVADYLSGLLIGAEIDGATAGLTEADPIIIVGTNDLTKRYHIALNVAGLTSQHADDDIAAQGHFAIAQSAGLLS